MIGQPFSYEPRPPKEFLEKVLSAGGEPAYMDCVYDSYRRLSGEGVPGSDETFDNFTPLPGVSQTPWLTSHASMQAASNTEAGAARCCAASSLETGGAAARGSPLPFHRVVEH